MKSKKLFSIFIITHIIPLPLLAIDINQRSFEQEDGFTLNTSGETILLGWEVAGNGAFFEFQFIPRQGNTAATPPIKALGINEVAIPLAYMELIGGDGRNVNRLRFDLSDTNEFDSTKIQSPVDLSNTTWTRIQVWGKAWNGAFIQPIFLDKTASC